MTKEKSGKMAGRRNGTHSMYEFYHKRLAAFIQHLTKSEDYWQEITLHLINQGYEDDVALSPLIKRIIKNKLIDLQRHENFIKRSQGTPMENIQKKADKLSDFRSHIRSSIRRNYES